MAKPEFAFVLRLRQFREISGDMCFAHSAAYLHHGVAESECWAVGIFAGITRVWRAFGDDPKSKGISKLTFESRDFLPLCIIKLAVGKIGSKDGLKKLMLGERKHIYYLC